MEDDGFARLSLGQDGILALVSDAYHARVLEYDTGGNILDGELILFRPLGDLVARSVSTIVDTRGDRFTAFIAAESLELHRSGPPSAPRSLLDQEVDALGSRLTFSIKPLGIVKFGIGDVAIFEESELLFLDDFESGQFSEEWNQAPQNGLFRNGWIVPGTNHSFELKWLDPDDRRSQFFSRTEFAMGDGKLDFAIESVLADTGALLKLRIVTDSVSGTVRLERSVVGTPSEIAQAPFEFKSGVIYVLDMAWSGANLRVHLYPAIDKANITELVAGAQPDWTPLFLLSDRSGDEDVAALAGAGLFAPFSLESGRLYGTDEVLGTSVSDMRTWDDLVLGMCLPVANAIHIGSLSRIRGLLQITFLEVVSSPELVLGTGVGNGNGEFISPLSFDRDPAPDGRFYVVDAGNSRIQVFDSEGGYLTQWGRHGAADDEFDFGTGSAPEDFAGSVVVDEEGFIYVADVGNKRIQKFEP